VCRENEFEAKSKKYQEICKQYGKDLYFFFGQSSCKLSDVEKVSIKKELTATFELHRKLKLYRHEPFSTRLQVLAELLLRKRYIEFLRRCYHFFSL